MARTKKCPDCAELVLSDARVCKHCGFRFDTAPEPQPQGQPKKSSFARNAALFAMLIAAVIVQYKWLGWTAGPTHHAATSQNAISPSTTTVRTAEDEEQERVAQEEACRADLQCWGDRKSLSATQACRNPIEGLAKLNYRWTDGWLESKLSRFSWNDRDKLIITYWGDKIEFQNGFGGWIAHTYKCIYDTENDLVIEASASPGRL